MLNWIVTHISSLELDKSPLLSAAFPLASGTIHFVLIKHLSDSLKVASSLSPKSWQIKMLKSIDRSREILQVIGTVSVAAVFMTVVRPFIPCRAEEAGSAYCVGIIFLINVFAGTSLMGLVVTGIVIPFCTLRNEFRRAQKNILTATAVICLRSGRRIKGKILDLMVLEKAAFFPIRLANGSLSFVETDAIDTIFMQECPDNVKGLPKQFKPEIKSLCLKFPHREPLGEVNILYSRLFTFVRVNNPASNTRHIITRPSNLTEIAS